MGDRAALASLDATFIPDLRTPAVLVVDHDPHCSSHCASLLEELGYRHHCAANAREALAYINSDPTIQIMLVNMQMPSIDGFVLIEEARSRATEGRAIAAVMLTEQTSIDLAIKGLHVEAVDLLCKPLEFNAYSTALRRAMRYLSARRPHNVNLSDFGEQLARLVSALENKVSETNIDGKLTDKEIASTLRTIIASRGLRNRYFPSELFADPAWDILLDLTRARLEGHQVSVSSVCIAASVPMSTALRWVRQMTEANLLRRWTDPKDRRRDLIALAEDTASNMRDYICTVHSMLQKI